MKKYRADFNEYEEKMVRIVCFNPTLYTNRTREPKEDEKDLPFREKLKAQRQRVSVEAELGLKLFDNQVLFNKVTIYHKPGHAKLKDG